ncbi:MAG: hypothetical protein KDK89_11105 [Alphaproteobacteria bacterium]|nr:hypothetical protein [Alphaproteobacteria bacterium]
MMDYRLDPLWLKLNLTGLQGAQALAPFMDLLQKQMGWNANMATRVIEEYRKFLFLAMRAGHQVIPPGVINDVWMLHLQNAQNYWEQLGQMIADRPMAGGLDAKSFSSMIDPWKQTLESYEKIFGTKPPMDIWGSGPATENNPWMQWMQSMKKMWGMG